MTDTARQTTLEQMLRERRRAIQDEVRRGIRNGRTDRPTDGGDALEHSDAGLQGDIDLALLQMRAETLARIDAALGRLEEGTYGSCVECALGIAARRLRALPFAVRCQACEERREQAQGAAPSTAQRRGRPAPLPDVVIF